MRYPRAVKPNNALNVVNVFAFTLGAPALADTDYCATDRAMSRTTVTIAHPTAVDGLAHNVTVKATQAGSADDTGMNVLVTGTNVDDGVITETITPVNGTTVAGTKAFKTVTAAVQAAWVIGGTTADRIEVGFGNLIGLPSSIRSGPGPMSAAGQVFGSWLGGAPANTAATWDADEIEKCTVDASSSTYNGSKVLTVLLAR